MFSWCNARIKKKMQQTDRKGKVYRMKKNTGVGAWGLNKAYSRETMLFILMQFKLQICLVRTGVLCLTPEVPVNSRNIINTIMIQSKVLYGKLNKTTNMTTINPTSLFEYKTFIQSKSVVGEQGERCVIYMYVMCSDDSGTNTSEDFRCIPVVYSTDVLRRWSRC